MTSILIVDDSITIRSLLKAYLGGYNDELLEAEDGLRALQVARLVPLDLVLTDIKMPVMDGLAFVRELRRSERDALRKLPVVLMTGEPDAGLEEEAIKAGATAFLRKPVDRMELARLVSPLLARRAR